ncbi:hypothetical protein HY338_01335 [Candidatus Gottesmanbacteria bacterium]|nr:hypothetical protein [Candidatus Gottesmanbacteria bacterium]
MNTNFIEKYKNKKVHIVGVTGSEGSSILRYLLKHNFSQITAHDFIHREDLIKSFRMWHKNIDSISKTNALKIFLSDLQNIAINYRNDYLKSILTSDLIFVPQSWRLYKNENLPLWEASKKKIPFYSLTRLYLEQSYAKTIGVTGTVGKGSTANLIHQLLILSGKSSYFAGNETWRMQVTDKLDEMNGHDYLVLEISHRQLQDGLDKGPDIAVFTNIYPNHLDETTISKYFKLKEKMFITQSSSQLAILNYDFEQIRSLSKKIKSEVIYFSSKTQSLNTKNIQKYYSTIVNNESAQYTDNILSAFTVLDKLGLKIGDLLPLLKKIIPLPARIELIKVFCGRYFVNDIKSTTPYATLQALSKYNKSVILICGGHTKNLSYEDFFLSISHKSKKLIILQSDIAIIAHKYLNNKDFMIVDDLEKAIKEAYKISDKGDVILTSPAGSFFYSDFIRDKMSLRKIITSLPPKD